MNDDEFVDNDSFNSPVVDNIESILGMVGLDGKIDQCYGCGLEGDLRTFTQRSSTGRLERRCPSCGSYEVHGKEAYK